MKPRILSDLNFQKANEHLGKLSEDIAKNEAFYGGDHWQNGDGWMGPRPTADDTGDVLGRIKVGFVSKNIVKEVVDRVVTAVLGRDPDWAFTRKAVETVPGASKPPPAGTGRTGQSAAPPATLLPFPRPAPPAADASPKAPPAFPSAPAPAADAPPEDLPVEDPLVDEANRLMMDWWSSPDKQLLKQMQKVLRKRLWGERGYCRLWVPFAYLEEGGTPKKFKIEEWSKHLYPDVPLLQDAALMEDIATMERVSVVRIPTTGFNEQYHLELSYLDDDDRTVVVRLASGADEEAVAAREVQAAATPEIDDDLEVMKDEIDRSDPLTLSGHLTLFEIKGDALVTPQVRQLNMLVNMAMTMLGHNTVEAGFSELSLTNVEMEKVQVPDPYAEGGYRQVSKSLRRGASVVHNFIGIQTESDDGKVQTATPGVHYHEPGSVDHFTATKREAYVSALEETHQIHALLSGDAAPSGESRIQALTDFASRCLEYKSEVDALGSWILETALAWLAELSGSPGKFNDLRANFASRVYVGKISAAERSSIIAQYKAGLLSRTTTMVLLEVADPDAEVEKIFADLARENQMAAEMNAAINPPEAVPPRAVAAGGPRPASASPAAPAAVKKGAAKAATIPLDAGSEAQWHSSFG